jgi:hypothetical protein
MPKRSSRRPPKDENQAARRLVDDLARLSGEDVPEPVELSEEERSQVAALLGRRGGLKGGPARAKKLSARRRKQIARDAARARWGSSS